MRRAVMSRLGIVLLHGLGCAVLSADALVVKDCEQTQGQFCRRGYVLQCPACTTQYCSDGVCAEDMVTTKNPLTGKVAAECGRRMFCMVKSLDGDYCDGPYVKQCRSLTLAKITDCRSSPCTEPIVANGTCGTFNFCADKLPGRYCDGEVVKDCPGSKIVEVCENPARCSQVSAVTHSEAAMRTKTVASCGDPEFCLNKIDGTHCDGPYLKTCTTRAEAAMQYCGVCSGLNVGAAECGRPKFCYQRANGTYCDGNVSKTCDGLSNVVAQQFCFGGCFASPSGLLIRGTCLGVGMQDRSAKTEASLEVNTGAIYPLVLIPCLLIMIVYRKYSKYKDENPDPEDFVPPHGQ